MKAQEQKVSELTYKFNKRLDVVIKANPNENFVVEDREKSEEMLKNKLYRLRGSNHPLQNQAIKYLQQDILELRIEERNLEIAQGKALGTLFILQDPLDNLLAIFEKLAERKTELQQKQNEKLKNIAEKSLSDTSYLFLFDEKTREEVQKFVVDIAKSQNQLTPKPLTAEDYLAISDKWVEEQKNSTSMSKGMSLDEISEKSTHYYQKYEFELQKEQEMIKTQNMESKEPMSYQDFTSEIEKMSAEEKRILYLLAKGTQEWEKFQIDSYLNDLEGYIQTIDIGNDSHQKINGLFNSMKAQFSLEQIIDSVSTQIKNNINDIEPDLDKIWEEIQDFSPEEKTYFKLRLDETTSGFIHISTDDFKQHFGKISNESHSKITEIIQSLSNGVEKVEDIEYLLSQQDKKLYENAGKLLHRIKTDSDFSKEIAPILSKLSENIYKSKNMEQTTQNQPAQEQQKKFDVIDYLNTQMKYLGFGDNHKEAIQKGIESNEISFQIHTTSDKVMEGNKVDFAVNFNKTEKGGIFLNSFDAKLTTAQGEERSNNFRLNFTAKEAINLLEGRAVKTELSNKEGEKYQAFVRLDFAEKKNDHDNYKLQIFNEKYGVNTIDIVNKTGLKYNDLEQRDYIIKSLEKGNIVNAKFEHEGKTIEGKAVLNPQYKTLNLYDKNMNRLNTNKPLQGLEQDNSHEKNNVREQSISRSM